MTNLEKIFELFGELRIGVLGDFCVDAYWILDLSEQEYSIETGKPTESVIVQRYSLGGGANIVANLASLGAGSIHAFSLVGNDLFGHALEKQLAQLNVDCSGMIVQEINWQTPVYCKRYADGEELERIDIGRSNIISTESERRLLLALDSMISDLDILIFNGQLSRGVSSSAIFDHLLRLAEGQNRCSILLDFRSLPAHFENMFVKLNAHEAAMANGEPCDLAIAIPEEKAKEYAVQIYQRSRRPVMVTRGERGLLIYDGERHFIVPGIQLLKPIDPVGAGDTTIAAWAVCLASGVPLTQAAELATLAAGVTVQKLQQTGTASPEEILAFAVQAEYIYHPEVAQNLRQARYLKGTQIEIVRNRENRGHVQHAVFDHDGTISVLREGWEPVMEAMMIRAILGEQFMDAAEFDYQRILASVREFIDISTGIQTILQMQALVDMVTEFGFVPKRAILTATEYKKIYNDALMKQVNVRKERLERRELDVNDFIVKGAVDLLNALCSQGVKLYLASGTDEEDVKAEAEILGYAPLFEGRIYGASGDISKYSKKLVIDRIITGNNLQGPELITFGDGPVEIRETKKRGGIAVGVASDEVRRWGLNQVKRTRLIRAGADYIVPDFSQTSVMTQHILDGFTFSE